MNRFCYTSHENEKRRSDILAIGIAVFSGFAQTMLMIAGMLYFREIALGLEWATTAAKFLPFVIVWTLVWPIFAYVGMSRNYRYLLEREKASSKNGTSEAGADYSGSASISTPKNNDQRSG